MLNGIGSVRCCRRRKGVGVVRSGMIGAWSRASSGGTGSGHRGGTCRVSSVRGRRYGSGTADTPVTAPGIASTRRCWPTPTMPAVSTGRSAWTRRSAVRTSTRRTCPGSQGDLSNYKNLRVELPDHGIGRSRGGLSSKIHQLVDGRGLPLVVVVGPGQAGDAPMFPVLMRHLRVARHGPGRPRWRPDRLRADKAYSSARSASTCVTAASSPSSQSLPTRPGTASAAALAAGDLPSLTSRTTAAGTYRARFQHHQAVARPRDPLRQARRRLPWRRCPESHHPLAQRARRHVGADYADPVPLRAVHGASSSATLPLLIGNTRYRDCDDLTRSASREPRAEHDTPCCAHPREC